MLKALGIIIAGLLTLASFASAGPLLTLSEERFDFGYVPQNSKVSHLFWLHNTGDLDLKIVKVTPGCGCTQAPLDKEIVPPGDSARLEIIFSTRLYFNNVSKSPTIECEGISGLCSVTISTYVIPRPDSARPLILEPFKLDISQYGEEVRDRATFTVTNTSDKELKLTAVDAGKDFGVLTLPESIGPKQTVEAELVLKPEMLGSELTRSVTFQVNDEKKTRYTVPVLRRLKDPRVGELVAPGE
jgi:hypothetical protein